MNPSAQPSAQPTIQDYWAILLRRKWLILGAMIICIAGAWALCEILPKSYRSRTLILVEGQRVPERYVQGVMTETVQEHLTLIQQQVLSRTMLSSVIREFNLFPEESKGEPTETLIEKMRASVAIDIKGGRRDVVEAFAISFAHEDPTTAMKVTAKLASKFIEENLKIREEFVEDASEFLEQELASAKVELERQEEAISEFKKQHMGELPEQTEANLRALDRLQEEVLALDESARVVSDRLASIKKAVMDDRASGEAQPTMADGTAGLSHLVKRLRELEERLSALSAEYKDSYPDIIWTKAEIARLRAQIAQEKENGGQERELATPPLDPYLHELHKERNQLTTELVSLGRQREQLTLQRQELQRRVARAPTVEQELLILLRDYENMKGNYQSLLDKRLSARIAENLEKRQKGEQFRVVDPANLPQEPESPKRRVIMSLGLLVGGGLGFGGAFALEVLLCPAFRRVEDVETALRIPVFAAIPDFALAYGQGRVAGFLPSRSAPHSGEKARMVGIGWRKLLAPGGSRTNGHRHVDPGAGPRTLELNLVAKWYPNTVVAEQFRIAATRLTLLQAEQRYKVVVVTSAVKGEGKSATAVNLSYVLARDLGKATLVLDFDINCPRLHAYAGVAPGPGLAELLQGTHCLDECLHQVEGVPLWVLPAGRTEGKERIHLAKGQRIESILGELRARFDFVILDAPPVLPLADAHVVVTLADFLLMVVRAGETRPDIVQMALTRLHPKVPAELVLTKLKAGSMPYYMQPGYYERNRLTDQRGAS